MERERFFGPYNPRKINSPLGKLQTCSSTSETHGKRIFNAVKTLYICLSFVYYFITKLIFFYKVRNNGHQLFLNLTLTAIIT